MHLSPYEFNVQKIELILHPLIKQVPELKIFFEAIMQGFDLSHYFMSPNYILCYHNDQLPLPNKARSPFLRPAPFLYTFLHV